MGSCCGKTQPEPGGNSSNGLNSDLFQSDESSTGNSSELSTTSRYVLDTLQIIRSLVDNDQEPPTSMLHLHNMADKESGWLSVVQSMVSVIPLDDPLGPAVITLLLDDCPLPCKETLVQLSSLFRLCKRAAHESVKEPCRHRNICVVLGCIAEKLAGPASVPLLTRHTLDYLVALLTMDTDARVILFALIALEKFAQTTENKLLINDRLHHGSDGMGLDATDLHSSELGSEHVERNKDTGQRGRGCCKRNSSAGNRSGESGGGHTGQHNSRENTTDGRRSSRESGQPNLDGRRNSRESGQRNKGQDNRENGHQSSDSGKHSIENKHQNRENNNGQNNIDSGQVHRDISQFNRDSSLPNRDSGQFNREEYNINGIKCYRNSDQYNLDISARKRVQRDRSKDGHSDDIPITDDIPVVAVVAGTNGRSKVKGNNRRSEINDIDDQSNVNGRKRKRKKFELVERNPLLRLEKWMSGDCGYVQREVGFCAQWCLDNLFVGEQRQYSYLTADTSNLNAMLNANDVSEYLKISPDGLQARCDAASFESVRCTYPVSSGAWYYEVGIVTAGVMQIGWATKDSKFLNQEGYGIGDDEYSVAYDGCRKLIWHKAESEGHNHPCWKPGDVLGSLLDLENRRVIFYLNGQPLVPPITEIFASAQFSGFFAAASFMSFQQCEFNFGRRPFAFPPKGVTFQSFNAHAHLDDAEKIILPRHLKLQQLRALSVDEGACTICCDQQANVTLRPCGHRGFCGRCAMLLERCPLCRAEIQTRDDGCLGDTDTQQTAGRAARLSQSQSGTLTQSARLSQSQSGTVAQSANTAAVPASSLYLGLRPRTRSGSVSPFNAS